METNLIGDMDMLREMGVRPSFSEMARRYGMDRHTVAKHRKGGAEMEDGRPARRNGFDRYRDETGDRAQIPGITTKAMHERLPGRHPDGKPPQVRRPQALDGCTRAEGGPASPRRASPLRDGAGKAAPIRLEGEAAPAWAGRRRVLVQRVERSPRILEEAHLHPL